MKLPIWKQEELVGYFAHTYTHLRHEESKENFEVSVLIILRNMSSMLNQLSSSRHNSLSHLLDWEKVKSVIKIFLHLA